jgi:hypothetical protein
MMQGGNDMSDGMMSSEVIMVPNKMVGLIIGRGGEQITRLVYQTFFTSVFLPSIAFELLSIVSRNCFNVLKIFFVFLAQAAGRLRLQDTDGTGQRRHARQAVHSHRTSNRNCVSSFCLIFFKF